jgi:hypothetical protein
MKIFINLKIILLSLFVVLTINANSAYLLIPMDNTQKNHLKAYGIAYWVLQHDIEISSSGF